MVPVGKLAAALTISGAAAASNSRHVAVPDFGPNVKIFDPSMSTADIKAAVDAVAARQVPSQFGTERDAFLFMPGTYGSPAAPLNFEVGYYTEVAGSASRPATSRSTAPSTRTTNATQTDALRS